MRLFLILFQHFATAELLIDVRDFLHRFFFLPTHLFEVAQNDGQLERCTDGFFVIVVQHERERLASGIFGLHTRLVIKPADKLDGINTVLSFVCDNLGRIAQIFE